MANKKIDIFYKINSDVSNYLHSTYNYTRVKDAVEAAKLKYSIPWVQKAYMSQIDDKTFDINKIFGNFDHYAPKQ